VCIKVWKIICVKLCVWRESLCETIRECCAWDRDTVRKNVERWKCLSERARKRDKEWEDEYIKSNVKTSTQFYQILYEYPDLIPSNYIFWNKQVFEFSITKKSWIHLHREFFLTIEKALTMQCCKIYMCLWIPLSSVIQKINFKE